MPEPYKMRAMVERKMSFNVDKCMAVSVTLLELLDIQE